MLIRYHNTLFKLQIILILVGAFRVGGARTPNSYESSACESRALTASAPILNDLSIITYLYVMLETEKWSCVPIQPILLVKQSIQITYMHAK